MRKLSAVIGMIAIALYASADVRNIRPPITGEGKLGTTTYKWGEVNAVDGYYSNLILGDLNITNKFLSPYDGEAGEVFYANGLGGGVWGAASSPTNGISQAVAESLFATVAQGAKADAALPKDGSAPMTGDLDMDGYDIDDAGVAHVESIQMTPNAPSLLITTFQMPLALDRDAKCGYSGIGDYIGADGGVGFYCVDSSNTNKFDLTYLSTNNYIMIQSPLIETTSNLVEAITGYGTCTADNDPVAGLVVGDNYVTFAHSGTIARTNIVTYTRFGSRVASFIPAQNAYVSIDISVCGFIAIGGYDRNEKISVLAKWATDITKPNTSSAISYMRTDYPIANFIDIKTYKNDLVMFGLYNEFNTLSARRLEPRYMIIKTDALCKGVTIID